MLTWGISEDSTNTINTEGGGGGNLGLRGQKGGPGGWGSALGPMLTSLNRGPKDRGCSVGH